MKEKVIDRAMNEVMASSTPTDAVQDLLRQIADENHLDIRAQLEAVPTIPQTITTPAQQEVAAQSSRLAALRHAI